MKYINASGGGGGGTGSDDVTALNKHVLEPYTAVTKESDDDPAKGTMKNLRDRATITHTAGNETKVLLTDEAYAVENSDGVRRIALRYNGDEGFITPNTLFAFPEAQAGAKFGITADKIANGQVVLGMTGTYKGLGNATAAQVLTGYSFSTAALSNAGGTMPNNGAWGSTLAINGSVTIPAGYHNGSGKVTQSIATKGATTITPKAAQQTAVGAGTYCSGNIIVAGNGNFVAGNIKKNVTIWGVRGTFEGWVPSPQDLYYNGVNTYGVELNNSFIRFENTRIYVYNISFTTTTLNWINFIQFTKAYNIKQYNKITFYGSFLRGPVENKFSADFRNTEIGVLSYTSTSDVSSVSFTITQIVSLTGRETLSMKTNKGTYINRIALS